jgi:hypothetical protein
MGWCAIIAAMVLATSAPVVLAWVAIAVRKGVSIVARVSLLGVLIAAYMVLPVCFFEQVGLDGVDFLTYGVASGFATGVVGGVTLAFAKTRALRFAAVVALCNLGLAAGVNVALFVLCSP